MSRCRFVCNRKSLLDAYTSGRLYTIFVEETQELFDDHEGRWLLSRALGCSPSWLLLPAFCVVEAVEAKSCAMIWVRSDLRHMGLGRLMVKELGISSAHGKLPESRAFWSSLGI